MPFRDRTGPEGKGPMNGRRLGYCAETDVPENIIPEGRGFGRGGGAGRGFGRGRGGRRRGRGFFATPATTLPEQEVNMLKSQAQSLRDALQRVNDRLDTLKAQDDGKDKT
ncbi:MAG: DUF5320 domain-containing protein [Chloroflexota bacterium]|nr:DUF5320 domain-containing protein [Chloroflexota bacterium]